MSKPGAELLPVISYPREAVLDIEHVAVALGVSTALVDKADLPCVFLGAHTRRFLWGDVLDALHKRSRNAA